MSTAQPEIEAAKDWINSCIEMRQTINDAHTSYGLKHKAEKWAGMYISNDSLIAAMVELGFKAKRVHPTSPNYFFNIKTLKEHLWQPVTIGKNTIIIRGNPIKLKNAQDE
jgi:hypothetical protein